MKANNEVTSNVKHSKALYAVAVYGFIILFFTMIFPFLPIYDGSSPFQRGITSFNNKVEGNLFATISMLLHSITLLIVLIVMLSKIKNYRAGAGYSFYKLYKNTIVTFFIVYAIIVVTGNSEFFYKSYGYEYWFVVCLAYAIGLLFCLVAQCVNKDLRPSKAKALYYFLEFVTFVALIFFFNKVSVNAKYFVEESEAFGDIIRYPNAQKNTAVAGVYTALVSVVGCRLAISFTHCMMPINAPFSFTCKRELNRSKYSKISFVGAHFDLAIYAIFFFVFVGNSLHNELRVMLLPLALTIVKYVAIHFYNKKVSAVMMPKPSYSLKYFTETSVAKKEEQTVSNATSFDNGAWSVNYLTSLNDNLNFKDKTTIDKMCVGLCEKLNDGGILIDKEQTKKVLAGVLSSKVTFIRCNADKRLIRYFSGAVSEFFGEDTFYEDRACEQFADEEINSGATSSFAFDSRSQTDDVQEEFAQDELGQEQQTATSLDVQDGDFEGQAQEDVAVQSNQTIDESQKTAEQIEEEQRVSKEIREKHSISCGMYVAHYLSNTFGLLFLNNTEQTIIEETDADVISGISLGDETVYIGKVKYCPENEIYSRGVIKVADNVRMIVFISDKEETVLDSEWIKYSTIIDLELVENKEAQHVLDIDCGTSYSMINQSLEEAQETCYLTEDYWRKIDKMEEYLEQFTDVRFDNRLIRQMEKNIAASIACGMDRKEALDAMLSEKIIPLIATEREKILKEHDADFSFKLDELFGFENIPLTKQAIGEYGLKK